MKDNPIKIESGIPIPNDYKTGLAITFRSMKVGESFLLPANQRNGLFTAAQRENIKILTRKDGDKIRVWRTE